MIDVICVNKDRTEAVVVYTNGRHLTLSHSGGLVADLVAVLLSPTTQIETFTQLISSQSDTSIIELEKVS